MAQSCSRSIVEAGAVPAEVVAARQCSAPAQKQLLQRLTQKQRVRVAIFGDSFGDGVWSGLQRQLPAADYEVVKYSQPAVGFTRYKRLNLETKAEEQLGSRSIEIAVLSFGANDTQGINTDKGEHAPLMSPKWQAQIGERLDRYVAMLRKRHAMVYWVGLPRMRDVRLDADIGAINAFYAERMAKLGVPFIDTRPVVADKAGGYSAYVDDPKTGEPVLVRASDGVHMSMTGYLWITRGLSQRIRAYVDATRAQAGGAPAAGR